MRVSEFASFMLMVVFTIFTVLFTMTWFYARWYMQSKFLSELTRQNWSPPAAIHYIFLFVIAACIVSTVLYLGVIIVVVSRLEGCSLDGDGQEPLVTHITLLLFPVFATLLMIGLESQYTAFLLDPESHRTLFINSRKSNAPLGPSSYVLSDNNDDAIRYVENNGLVRYNLLKHQYRLIRAAVPLFALYALVAVFHAEDPRQYVGACQQRDRLREDFGRTVRVSVKSTRATPRKTVDEMESRQLFIGYTVSCSGSMGEGATALAREVCEGVGSGSVALNRTVELPVLPDDVAAERGLLLGLGVFMLFSVLVFQLTMPPFDFMFHIFRYGYVPEDAYRYNGNREQEDREKKLAYQDARFVAMPLGAYTLPRVVAMHP